MKAVLAKTSEVAVAPRCIEANLPHWATARNNYGASCPNGLIKAKVIQNGYPWIEKRPVTLCGDQDYEIKRRNGVLVEFEAKDLIGRFTIVKGKVYSGTKMRSKTPYPHTTVVVRDDLRFVQMVVSRKVIAATWAEYDMIQAQREKEIKAHEEKRNRLLHPQAALMGMTPEEFDSVHGGNRSTCLYLSAEWERERDKNGNYKRDSRGRTIESNTVAKMEITLAQANKILSLLTDEQKEALKNG